MVSVEGFDIPEDLYYLVERHVYAKVETDGIVKVGYTDTGQALAKKILFVRLKKPGTSVQFDKAFGTIESAKWVGPSQSPVDGTIIEGNKALRKNPSLVNEAPYTDGWMVRIKPTNLEENLKKLLKGEEAVEAFKKEIKEKNITKE